MNSARDSSTDSPRPETAATPPGKITAQQDPQAERRQLDRSFVRGMAWTGSVRWLAQLLSWLSTFVVARILTPEDYGIVSMAVVVANLMGPVADFGIGTAIVQKRDLRDKDIAQLGGLLILFGFLTGAIVTASSGWLARLFQEPSVRGVIMAYGAVMVVAVFRVLPEALLRRELRYEAVARIQAVESFTSIAAVLTFAVAGFGYWALVGGFAAGQVTGAIAAQLSKPHPVARPRDAALAKNILGFGFHLTTAKLSWHAYNQGDFAIAGRVLGSALLGAYTIGWQLASVPVERIGFIFSEVATPLFARIQSDHRALTRYLLRTSEGLALITMPATIGLAIVADDFVAVALGPKWNDAVLPLRILCCYSGFRSLDVLMQNMLIAKGLVSRVRQLAFRSFVVLIPLFYLGARWWGLGGVAAAWVVGLPIASVIPAFRTVSRLLGFGLRDYLVALRAPLEATGLMAGTLLLLGLVLPPSWSRVALLAIQVLAGVAIYGLVLRLRHWDRINAFRHMLRDLKMSPQPHATGTGTAG